MLDRKSKITEFWDRSRELSVKQEKYQVFIKKFWYFLLDNDIGKSDITTDSLITKNKKISAVIVAKENGIFAGSDEIIFLNGDLKINRLKKDGRRIKKGDILLEIRGDAKKILSRERIFLNLLQRMSGIATLADSLNEKLGGKIKIAATRKTLWGYLDKNAVSIGKGLTHRLNLEDGILIKDNHLALLNYDIKKALESAKNKSDCIEIEVESKEQAISAAKLIKKNFQSGGKLFAIMLDKINPYEIKSIVAELKNQDLYENVLLEASGNITPDNVSRYKDCGADIISMGWLTNSAKSLDMSMDIVNQQSN